MDFLSDLFSLFLHLDRHLAELAGQYGSWIYGILFLIVFCETGLVVTPFLPGDSLLFAAGSLAAIGSMNIHLLFLLMATAAILGNTVNYTVGRLLGEKAFTPNARILKQDYLHRTHRFFERHGGKTIVITRFVPLVRTFAPFVAGVGAMTYSKFIVYNVVGGIAWVLIFTLLGYFFGNVPFVQHNFEYVIIAIVLISVLPAVWEFIAEKTRARNELPVASAPEESAD